ncbi:MAG: hypothetical protein IJL03_00855 [Lachnospiraceae bacterium]|nr:hypothetical protein [Lachnospiraceae bacterium]
MKKGLKKTFAVGLLFVAAANLNACAYGPPKNFDEDNSSQSVVVTPQAENVDYGAFPEEYKVETATLEAE